MSLTKALVFISLVTVTFLSSQVDATPVNLPPPPGFILNLDGQPLPQLRFAQYSVNFTATNSVTGIMFAERDDPGYTLLDNVSVNNTDAPDANLIQNGGFENGDTSSGGSDFAPQGWTYRNPHALVYHSVVKCGFFPAYAGNCVWVGQTEGAYDWIAQSVDTVIGDTYQINFHAAWVPATESSLETHWSQVSTNGLSGIHANGVNIAVYADSASPTTDVPEPAALGMFGLGLLFIGGATKLRRRRSNVREI